MCNSDSEMLATIENLGLTIEQLGEAYRSDDYKNLQQVLNKLDKKTLVELTSKLAVYSMVTMIQMSNDLKMQLDKNNQLATIGQRGIENMSDMRDIEKKGEKIHKSKQAKRGGETKRDNNKPMQDAKTKIKQKWLNERETINSTRGGKAKFYKDMQNQYRTYSKDENGKEICTDVIKDTKTIQNWVAGWEKELL